MEKQNGKSLRSLEARPIASPPEECSKQCNLSTKKEPSISRKTMACEQVVSQNAPSQVVHQTSSRPVCSPSIRNASTTPTSVVGSSRHPSHHRGHRLCTSDDHLSRKDCSTAAKNRREGIDQAPKKEKTMSMSPASRRKKHGTHARKTIPARSSSTSSKMPNRDPKSTSPRRKADTTDASTNTVISSELVLLSLISTVRSDRACNKSTQTVDTVVRPTTRPTEPLTSSLGTSPPIATYQPPLKTASRRQPRAVKSDTSVVTAHNPALKSDERRGPTGGYSLNVSYEQSIVTEDEEEYRSTFLSSDPGSEEETPAYLYESADPGSSSLLSTLPLNRSTGVRTLKLARNIQPKNENCGSDLQYFMSTGQRRGAPKYSTDTAGRHDEIYEVTEEFFEANSRGPDSDSEATAMVVREDREETLLEEYSLSEDISGSDNETTETYRNFEEKWEEDLQNTRNLPMDDVDDAERPGVQFSKRLKRRIKTAPSRRNQEAISPPLVSTHGENPTVTSVAGRVQQYQIKQAAPNSPVSKHAVSNHGTVSSSPNCQVLPGATTGLSCVTTPSRGFHTHGKSVHPPKQYVDAVSNTSGVQYSRLCANCQDRKYHFCNSPMTYVKHLPHQGGLNRHADSSITRHLPCPGAHGQSVPAPLQCQRCLERTTSKTSRKQTRRARSNDDHDERRRRSNDSIRSTTSRSNTAPGSKGSVTAKRMPRKGAENSQKCCKKCCKTTSTHQVKATPSTLNGTSKASSSKSSSRGPVAQPSGARSLVRSSKENAASPVVAAGQRPVTHADEDAQGRNMSSSQQEVPNGGKTRATPSTSRAQKERAKQVASSASDRNQGIGGT